MKSRNPLLLVGASHHTLKPLDRLLSCRLALAESASSPSTDCATETHRLTFVAVAFENYLASVRRTELTFLSSEILVKGFSRNEVSCINAPRRATRLPVYPDMNK